MSRIAIPTRDDAPAASQLILDGVYKQLGFVPNLHRLMSISPDVLTGFISLQSSLAKTLDIKTRNTIALAVSEMSGCGYGIAAHSYVATNLARMSPQEITLNRQGGSHDAKRAAAASFAQHLMKAYGKVSDADLRAVRDAGYSDAQIIEMVALSAQFVLTDLINHVAQTNIDFPAIPDQQAKHRDVHEGKRHAGDRPLKACPTCLSKHPEADGVYHEPRDHSGGTAVDMAGTLEGAHVGHDET
jgi:uncharacterized peroxidase-related enzyme